MHCLFGSGVDTAERIVFAKDRPDGKSTIFMGDGDGTVNRRSLSACQRWIGQQRQRQVYAREFPKRDHMAVLKVSHGWTLPTTLRSLQRFQNVPKFGLDQYP